MRANVVADMVGGLVPQLQAERDFLPFRRPLTEACAEPRRGGGPAVPSNPTARRAFATAQRAVPDLASASSCPALQIDAQRLTLKQRALATTRITWNDRSTQYTTVIAVLAVALFLVGFGLIVEGPIRRSAYILGRRGRHLRGRLGGVDLHAADPVHAGRRDRRGRPRRGADRQRRLPRRDRAVRPRAPGRRRLRPRVHRPVARPAARREPRLPVDSCFHRPEGRATAAAADDAQRALDLDGSRGLLGFSLVGLTDFYRGRYAEAVAATDGAAAVNPGVPDVWLLRSAALVALGDDAGASASLKRAFALLRGAEPSQQTRLLASTYLSYLGWVRRYVPAQAAAAQRLADRTVAVETAFTLDRKLDNTAPPTGSVAVRALRYVDGVLTLTLTWHDLPQGTAVSAIEYERPIEAGAWAQPAQLALFATLGGTGRRVISVPLERVCQPTRVRADVYLDGARVRTQTGPGVAATC